jgi:hypothetical protein
MTVLMNKIKDPYRPALFRGETVPSTNGLAGGIVMRVQGNHAKTRTTTKMKSFLLYLRNFPEHPCGQRDPNSEKRKDCAWKRPRLDNAAATAVR